MLRRTFLSSLAASTLLPGLRQAGAQNLPYGLLPGKPHEGTTLNILSVVTPQFNGLKLRDDEFTRLTGINTEWTFIPFGNL
ncbi:MAG: hypothetical protein MPK06_07535 [Alphaproteobacteria bacterium]|nr:hypothetical protein [Alphaproteobacteria bacterium]MDA8004496.1 hypothetical protein [Alphaproteobacteria bacterium]MDA8006365.1 hypothetical protein [Alphaproteobacteria bacterium]MDA8013727.1 hypothetical protein [Alphaproteobacteria bacterium]